MDMSINTTLKIGLDTYRLVPSYKGCEECAFWSGDVKLCPRSKDGGIICHGTERVWEKIPVPFDTSISIPSDDIARVVCMKANHGLCRDSSKCQRCELPCRKEINREIRRLCGEPFKE